MHPIRQELLGELSTPAAEDYFQVGVVSYQRPPNEIDFSELWEKNPSMAKAFCNCKFQQSDGVGDAKIYINNMLRNGDWANFALRCDEAIALREQTVLLPVARVVEPSASGHSPFERSPAERRESALGLARFKVSQGLAIAQQFGFVLSEINPTAATLALACAA